MKFKTELSRKLHDSVVFDLKKDLVKLEGNLKNTDLLLSFQFKIIRNIIRSERMIKGLKSFLGELKATKRKGGLKKEQSKLIKENIKSVEQAIDDVKFKIYIFKMFGDSVAFLYLDKFDIKHFFYNVVDYSPKESAGYMGGKDGLKEEWELVKKACKAGVPTLLNDITMSMRHGDVCLLGEGAPVLVEVKSSQNKNNRVERQKNNLNRLAEFLAEDKAEDFRGMPLVLRKELCFSEVTYKKEFNEHLNVCREKGISWVRLEDGFYVVSNRGCDLDIALSQLDLRGGEIAPIFLNEYKNNQLWVPLTPFVNLINDARDLCDFINGELTILCVLDLDCFKQIALNEGFELVFVDGEDYSMIFKELGGSLILGVSWQMMLRTPLEMVSMSWLIKDSIDRFKRLQKQHAEMQPATDVNTSETSLFEKYRPLFTK